MPLGSKLIPAASSAWKVLWGHHTPKWVAPLAIGAAASPVIAYELRKKRQQDENMLKLVHAQARLGLLPFPALPHLPETDMDKAGAAIAAFVRAYENRRGA